VYCQRRKFEEFNYELKVFVWGRMKKETQKQGISSPTEGDPPNANEAVLTNAYEAGGPCFRVTDLFSSFVLELV
jgi:hypothetical protein